ncbi:hypothetical protein ASE85_07900 [Sphingobium sp. Leaf26]|uniref:hypothetical protein n=1 Tax=Sphingobium sp. Leaf26 TaxID=1735693 RepID=UPI0007127F74|nr:hypothetical protein [Sphingobium sp. Leaf26]KQN04897.1 hypothetical protein ASE85_07900 [Sphingobium sp. Leaf26]
MKIWLRTLVILGSVGWIIPLCIAFAIGRSFAWLTFRIAVGEHVMVSWHPFEAIAALFYGAMIWLAIAIICWTFYLTKKV